MVEIKKCLDTYALIEIAKANPKFAQYINSNFVITDLTLAEFYAVLLREFNEQTAEFWKKKIENYSLQIDREILIEAVKFRHINKKSDISFFDATGYIFSLKTGCRFVTGDKEFEKLESVEFIKK